MSENDNNGDFGAFLAGFVIGGLVGAATALILAPRSGAETRDQIAGKGRELRSAGQEQAARYQAEYRDLSSQAVESARARAQTISRSAQEQARIVLDRGKDSNVAAPAEEMPSGESVAAADEMAAGSSEAGDTPPPAAGVEDGQAPEAD